MQLALFLKTALLFGSVQALTMLAASRISIAPPARPLEPLPVSSVVEILMIFGLAVLAILFLIRFQSGKSATILRALWLLALLAGTNMFFAAFLDKNIALPLAILLILIYAKAATVGYHNFVLVIGLAGIGAALGSQIAPREVVLLLMLLSVYDVIAVYWTRHMVKMAESFIGSGVMPGIIISVDKKGPLWVNEVRPSEETAILGTGDLVLPAILASSALKFMHPIAGISVAVGALAGLFLMHLIFFKQKERKPMPALPPIAAGAIGGFLISFLIV
jgi:presenilin-like A22 family membrane protease